MCCVVVHPTQSSCVVPPVLLTAAFSASWLKSTSAQDRSAKWLNGRCFQLVTLFIGGPETENGIWRVVPLALLTGSQPQGKSPGSHSVRTQFKTNKKKMLKVSHPALGSHCRAASFAAHCTADGSFRQIWYSSLAQRSPQESSFVGTGSVFLSAPSKACFGEQQQLQFTGTYSSSPQTAPAIPDGESLSSPSSLEIPHEGLGKCLTCSSSHQKSVTGFQPNLQPSSMDHVQPWEFVLAQGEKQWKHTAGVGSITEAQGN